MITWVKQFRETQDLLFGHSSVGGFPNLNDLAFACGEKQQTIPGEVGRLVNQDALESPSCTKRTSKCSYSMAIRCL